MMYHNKVTLVKFIRKIMYPDTSSLQGFQFAPLMVQQLMVGPTQYSFMQASKQLYK